MDREGLWRAEKVCGGQRGGGVSRDWVGWAERGGLGKEGGRGLCGQRAVGREWVGLAEGVMGRESNGFEGAKRPFGCERSEPSCPGPGSAERSAAERGPNSS